MVSVQAVSEARFTPGCLQYVLHFPKGERYVSILKETAEPQAQANLDAERTRLKAVIKLQLAESAMLTEADEGLGQAASLVSPGYCAFLVTDATCRGQ